MAQTYSIETFKIPGSGKIKRKDLPIFTRLFAAMIDAGMPLVQVLQTLETETQNKMFQPVVEGVRGYIEAGESLSESMSHYPTVFDDLYVSMMRAGESSGLLSDIAARLATYLEEAMALRRKITSAMMYPVMVTVVTILLTTGMMLFIVPAFATIYADFDATLPAPTQFLIDTSDFLRKYFPFVFGGLIALGFLFSQYKRTPSGRYNVDKLKLKLPVFGNLTHKVALARFASTFAELTRAGVPILKSLDIVATATDNAVMSKAVMDAKPEVESGENLSVALAQSTVFPGLIIQMMSAGEKSGKVDDMLHRISAIFQDEVDATVSGLTSLIEPLLIVFLGIVVGGIVIAMFLPIFKLSDIVS